DAEILRLVAARVEAARAIGRAKQEQGIPLRDFEVERQVLERAARHADALQLSRDVARSITQLLSRESCAAQEELRDEIRRDTVDDMLISGGLGRMGRWFARFSGGQGLRVRICDPVGAAPDAASTVGLAEGLQSARFALVAAPLDRAPDVLSEIAS